MLCVVLDYTTLVWLYDVTVTSLLGWAWYTITTNQASLSEGGQCLPYLEKGGHSTRASRVAVSLFVPSLMIYFNMLFFLKI